jgi:hypothetical protein
MNDQVEVQDEQGNVLGAFNPSPTRHSKASYTIKEVFEFLKTLTTDPARLADLDRHISAIDARDRECDAR